MTVEDAVAILLHYQMEPPTTLEAKRVELAAANVVGEHAKQAINRYFAAENQQPLSRPADENHQLGGWRPPRPLPSLPFRKG